MQGDEEMLHILRGVNNDLVAVEAKYHKVCYATYMSNSKHEVLKKGAIERTYADTFDDFREGIENIFLQEKHDMSGYSSMFKRSYVQKVLCLEGPLFRRSYV